MRSVVHHRSAVLALVLACAGTPAAAGLVFDDFEANPLGGLPSGWGDVANIDPASTTPKPSGRVVGTTDAFGSPTRAVATVDKPVGPLPSIAPTQGIYRPIGPSSFYSTSADVRIDRFSDVTNFDCGCPPALMASSDWPMQIGFSQLLGTLDPSKIPTVALLASSREHDWRLLVGTANVAVEFDLGVPITLGTWYGVQIDLDAAAGTVHSRIGDIASGSTLADVMTVLPASWNPMVDGMLDIAGYFGGELTAVKRSSLATIDNIRISFTPVPEPGALMLLASALLAFGAVAVRRL